MYDTKCILQNVQKNDKILYKAKIKINGVFTIGTYSSEEKAAIAYNKAIDMAHTAGINKKYNENYIDTLSPKEYAQFYTQVKISPKYINYINSLTKPD